MRHPIVVVIGVSALYAFLGLYGPLRAPDEIRVAEIGREMALSGDLLVPRLGGEPFLEHPPLFYALVAGSFTLFGVSDGAARLPATFATMALLLLAFDLGRRLGGARLGLLAALVLATTSGFLRYGHRAMVDIWLACGVGLACWAYARLLLDHDVAPDRRPLRPSPGLVLTVYAGAALAALVKGPVGPLLVAVAILADLVRGRRGWMLRSWAHAGGLALLAVACTAWPLLLFLNEGAATFRSFALDNVVRRIVPSGNGSGEHLQPPWFYLTSSSIMLPWVVTLPALWFARRRAFDTEAARFLALVFPLGVLALSVPGSKRTLYLLPLLMPLAVAIACWLDRLGRAPVTRLERSTLVVLAAPFALLSALLGLAVLGCARAARRLQPSGTRWHAAGRALLDAFDLRSLRSTGPRVVGALFAMGLLFLATPGVQSYPDRDMRELTADLDELDVLDKPLAGYRLDERTRATVPFRTGVILPNLVGPDALRQFLVERPGAHVLMPTTEHQSLPEADRAGLGLVRDWTFGRHRYGLYSASPGWTSDP